MASVTLRGREAKKEDKRRRTEIERRNQLDNLCYTIEKTLQENRDKIPEGDVSTLEEKIKEARGAIERQDSAAVTAALATLEAEAHRVAKVLYEKASPPESGQRPASGQPDEKGPDKVVDAEFEETGS